MVENVVHERVYCFVCAEDGVKTPQLALALLYCVLLRLTGHRLVLVINAAERCLVELEVYHSALVEHRACSTIGHRLRHIVNIYVVAEHLSCRAVFLRDGRTRKANVGGIWQRVTHSACCSNLHSTFAVDLLGQSVLATMCLVGNYDYISACREGFFALLELLHRGKEYTVCLALTQQFAKVLAAIGLYRRLA